MQGIKKVAVVANQLKKNALTVAESLVEFLKRNGVAICRVEDLQNNPHDAVLCCVGGDGTFLKAAHTVFGKNIPIIGVNTGNKGFLMQTSPEDMEKAFLQLISGKYAIQYRSVIAAFVKSRPDERFLALNEILVHRNMSGRILKIDVKVNDIKIDNISADGILISTPTGSTAYSLSCGGAIISPAMKCLQIVPVNSHSMHSRPLVISDSDCAEIKIANTEEIFLSSDGSVSTTVSGADSVIVRKAEFELPVISFETNDFYRILPRKIIFQSFVEEKD